VSFTNQETLISRYHLLQPPSWVQILPSASCSTKASAYVLPSVRCERTTVDRIRSKKEKLQFCKFASLCFRTPSSRVQTRLKPSGFSGEKILSTPSFGGEVKPSVPCRVLRHVKEPKSDVEVARHFRQNFSTISCPCFHLPLLGSLVSLQTLGASCGESWNALNPRFSSKFGV
jgi:hypothetical protein